MVTLRRSPILQDTRIISTALTCCWNKPQSGGLIQKVANDQLNRAHGYKCSKSTTTVETNYISNYEDTVDLKCDRRGKHSRYLMQWQGPILVEPSNIGGRVTVTQRTPLHVGIERES
jgi:hypothetical protein